MNFMGLIGSVADQISVPKGLWEWLLRLISGAVPTYVLAIIIFTVLLKIILSPLDFFQRYKMKKNERITKKLQPEMDKLARQYGDDKATLQQKQFQLQRAAGLSIFSSCIPMILTMVVFFSFFAGMRNISQYEEFSQYVNRYDIYTDRYVDLTGLNLDGTAAMVDDTNTAQPSEEFDDLIDDWWNSYNQQASTEEAQKNPSIEQAYLSYYGFDSFGQYYEDYLNRAAIRNFVVSNSILQVEKSDESGFFDTAYIYSLNADHADAIEYLSGLKANIAQHDDTGEQIQIDTFSDFRALYDDLAYYDDLTSTYVPTILSVAENAAAQDVYDDYKSKKPGFLWIKSIWAADVPWTEAVPHYSKFRSNTSSYMVSNKGDLSSSALSEVSKKETYEKVMSKVLADDSLSGTNGYLVLAFLAVGLSFLSQFISMRQQKRAGTTTSSNSTFKAMLYIMPLMIGVFAVISTSAFSIYMITNSIMTLLINLLTTFIMTKMFKKERQDEVNSAGIIKYGRKDPNDKK